MNNSQSLQRYLEAQTNNYNTALSEIRNGRKRGHWIWYIFPQLRGLGKSTTSEYYGLRDFSEAKDYLKHPVLGMRLREISEALLQLQSNDALQIMGDPDHIKLHSSMTLFAAIPEADPVFKKVLEKFYHGNPDRNTLQMIEK